MKCNKYNDLFQEKRAAARPSPMHYRNGEVKVFSQVKEHARTALNDAPGHHDERLDLPPPGRPRSFLARKASFGGEWPIFCIERISRRDPSEKGLQSSIGPGLDRDKQILIFVSRL